MFGIGSLCEFGKGMRGGSGKSGVGGRVLEGEGRGKGIWERRRYVEVGLEFVG